MACAFSIIWITFVPMDDAGGHRWGKPSLFVQGGTASVRREENILPTPQTYWLDSTIFPEWFGTSHFSLSACGNQKMLSQEGRQQQPAAGNSWLSQTLLNDLPAAGSAECHSKATLSLASVPSLLTLFYFRGSELSQNKIYMGRDGMRTGPSISYLPSRVS